MSKSTTKRVGRPVTFTSAEIKSMQKLMKRFGISHTQRILAASKGADAEFRKETAFTSPRSVSQPTLKRYAVAAGIELHRGRPSAEVIEGRENGKRKTFAMVA